MIPSVSPLSRYDETKPQATEDTEQTQGISLADIWRSLVHNKWLILTCILVAVAGTTIYVVFATPVFEAAASIRIDPTRAGSLGLNDLLSMVGSSGSGEQIQTEMSILQSDQVAMATLDALTPQQFHTYTGMEKGTLNFSPSNKQMTRVEENILAGFKAALSAKQVEGTQLVGIHFRNASPEIAAVIVNNVISAYIRGNFDSRYESVTQVRAWLSSQMDELRTRASNGQKKLAEFQEENNLVGSDPANNTTIDRLKLLNERLTVAEGDRIIKEAQLRAASTGDPAVLASLLPDPQLQSLQQEEGTLYSQYVEQSTKFGAA